MFIDLQIAMLHLQIYLHQIVVLTDIFISMYDIIPELCIVVLFSITWTSGDLTLFWCEPPIQTECYSHMLLPECNVMCM